MKEFRLGLLVLVSWLILMLAIGAGLIGFGYVIATDEVQREIRQSLAQVSRIGVIIIENRLDALTVTSEQLARDPKLARLVADRNYYEAEEVLYAQTLGNDALEFGVLSIVTPDGVVRANGGSMNLSAEALTDVWQQLNRSNAWQFFNGEWAAAVRGHIITDPVLGKNVGMLVYGLSLEHNLALARDIVEETGTIAAAITVNDRGLSRYPLTQSGQPDVLSDAPEQPHTGQEGLFTHWTELPIKSVYLQLVQSSDRVYDLTRAFQTHFVWLIPVTVIAGMIVYFVVRVTFLRHATILADYAKNLSDKPDDVTFPRGVVAEFNDMGEALSGTFQQLKDAQQALQKEYDLRIDDLRRLTQEHTISDNRLRLILDSAVDGIITVNNEGYITSFNPSAEKLFGWHPAEAEGLNFAVLMSAAHNGTVYSGTEGIEILADMIFRWEQQEDPRPIDVVALRKDKSTFIAEISVSELINEELHIYTVILRDVSSRKVMEKRLQASMDDLQESREKNRANARQFKDILDSSNSAIVICSEKIDLPLYSNARYFDLFGIRSPGDLHAVGGQAIFPVQDQLDILNNAIFNHQQLNGILIDLCKIDGSPWRALIDVRPVQYQEQQASIIWIHPLGEPVTSEVPGANSLD